MAAGEQSFFPELVPPEAFAIVEPGLYRSSAPYPVNLPYLRRLGLRTAVYLSAELPADSLSAEHLPGLRVVHLGLASWHEARDADGGGWDDVIKAALELALNKDASVSLSTTRRTEPG